MKLKKITAIILTVAMTAVMLGGCGNSGNSGGDSKDDSKSTEANASGSEKSTDSPTTGEIKEFTAFIAVPGNEINDDNEVQQAIAEITGAKVKETWLTGQTAQEAVGTIIAGGEYPDFIDGSDGMAQLYDAGALIALDDYLDDYPNIKEFFTDTEWDSLRRDDGHIYWIPQFSSVYEKDMSTLAQEAFWIQTRVLKWDNYPEITTMDQYFDLIERYNEANPTMEDGTANIPYTILCDDWRYFCLENAGEFLDGYPNDGSVIVDPETETIIDYNTTATSKLYFQKLNEEYQKGIVDPESFIQIYDEYIAKLSTGRVLGMIDQYWNYGYVVIPALKQQGLDEQGCCYVPLPITIDESVQNQWFTTSKGQINVASGLAITTSCKDVEGALQLLDDLLSPEVARLREWGIEGIDYLVDEEGVFYRTDEMRSNADNTSYKASHLCVYSYFPEWNGMSKDGINANKPEQQPGEFFDSLPVDTQECLEVYGCYTYVDMLGVGEIPGPWFPMWSYSNGFTTATEGGTAWAKIGEVKHEYLPKVVMADDFESAWEEYMGVYEDCNPQAFIEEMQTELDRRIQIAAE